MNSLLRAPAAFILYMLTASSVQSTVLPPQGGAGGGSFVVECPGQYLVGVSLRTGGWVDAIAPLCASYLPAQDKFGKWKRGVRKGGSGGSPLLKDSACPADRYISSITIGLTAKSQYLDYVLLFCSPIKDRSAVTKVCAQSDRGCGDIPSHDQACPTGEAATGIHGRYGAYVDSLGLVCGPKPKFVGSKISRREIYGKLKEHGNRSDTSGSASDSAKCKSGFVWRVARPADLVCVTPESRARVAQENTTAASRREPGGGAYGANTCKSGFVWREAFNGDVVCVTPEVRTLVREENSAGQSRRAE